MERVLTGIEQVLIVFPDYILRRSPNLEEVSVPELQVGDYGSTINNENRRDFHGTNGRCIDGNSYVIVQ